MDFRQAASPKIRSANEEDDIEVPIPPTEFVFKERPEPWDGGSFLVVVRFFPRPSPP